MVHRRLFCCLLFVLAQNFLFAQSNIDTIGLGWSRTSVNTVVFRKNSISSNGNIQYAAYYDSSGFIVLAKRTIGTGKWDIKRTPYQGTVADAHNSISIIVDGDGYLHIAWDHHNSQLRYCRSVSPGSLTLTSEMQMTGLNEQKVTYPEFHKMPSGDILFFYRSGESGKGNLVVNKYTRTNKKWSQLHDNLIDGEGERNAYWQACVDGKGIIHLSWVWRETWDVSTNHDLCYAQSKDGGVTWVKKNGERYQLPITASTAEYAFRIPQNSELINQTSMCADDQSRPYIATYWKEKDNVPQYYLIFHDGKRWNKEQVTKRSTDFSLRGAGTKKIPISRPQIVVGKYKGTEKLLMVYRDTERGSRITVASKTIPEGLWTYDDISTYGVGDWEPSYDIDRWNSHRVLNLFVQRSGQGDGEKTENLPAQPVVIVEY